MKKTIIGRCPLCESKLIAKQLECTGCQTTINSDFNLSKFDYLSKEEKDFALVFIKNAGNIKQIEKELNISYPTVKKMLDQVITNLGFETISNNKLTRIEILGMLKNDEISFEEAEELLKEIGE